MADTRHKAGPASGETSIYNHYANLGQDIVRSHGKAKQLAIRKFNGRLGFVLCMGDGTEIQSNNIKGPVDGGPTVGYWGTGPRLTRYFLEGAGIFFSLEEIERWRDGTKLDETELYGAESVGN